VPHQLVTKHIAIRHLERRVAAAKDIVHAYQTTIASYFWRPAGSFYAQLKAKKAFVAELRPALEGMKDVARELIRRGIQPVVICDNMMAFCMERKLVSVVHIFAQAGKNGVALCRTVLWPRPCVRGPTGSRSFCMTGPCRASRGRRFC
jgi:hypothetical protein